jgi:hypothetical protein
LEELGHVLLLQEAWDFIAECPQAMEIKPEHKHYPRTDHKHHSRDDHKGKHKSERRPKKSGGHKKECAMVSRASDIDSSSSDE